ncbi:hypothetical protein GCM10027277_08990 [Pseudoduganella ginsengisoli]|uniref:Uncharacterized protein n=1 Tax=Pseudoduganella ginsengisoli TaxID=1462440 RepID=A0A6L6PZU3_9BURK|nr:hypothetical protein [Pseudoduganella ginsengisoli]MTW03163.1 hypothetical protein [Pseudoduganella ginsengisoli]
MSANLAALAIEGMTRKAALARRKVDGLGGATASGAVGYAAARVARIVLRREPVNDEVLRWTSIFASQPCAARGRAELAIALLALPETAQLDAPERLARSYDAVMGRYDTNNINASHGLDALLQRLAVEGLSETEMIRLHFVRMHDIERSGSRSMPCAAPVDARRPFFALRDSHGMPLVFAVGANGHLHLFRRTAFGNWSQTDLSAALPAFDSRASVIECIDMRQGADGAIAVALAVSRRSGDGGCALYAAAGLAASLDEAGWVSAFAAMPERRRGLPDGATVNSLALGPVLPGAAAMVLVTADTPDGEGRWYFNAANPVTAIMPLPQGSDPLAIGCYRLPGAWSLAKDGSALSFVSFPDPFNWGIDIAYQAIPRRACSFVLAPGSVPNVPDVYVAGDGIVVYRGGHTLPLKVADTRGARLVWCGQDAQAEHIAYSDGSGGLWLVSRAVGSSWGRPHAVGESLVATSLCVDSETGGVHAVGVTPGGALMWMRVRGGGEVVSCEEIAQLAVWEGEEEAAEFGTAA